MKAYNKVANTMFTVCIHITMYTVHKVSKHKLQYQCHLVLEGGVVFLQLPDSLS